MDWQKFVSYFEEHDNSPIVVPLLKRAVVVEEGPDSIKIGCENRGAHMYLEDRRASIQSHLNTFAKREISISFVIQPSKKKEKKTQTEALRYQEEDELEGKEPDLPLIQYKENLDERARRAGLQPIYTFENFAVSNSNHIAHAAARAVATNPGSIYNPLFLYGNVGVGKTHLSHAIANLALEKNPSTKIYYCSSEEFTNDLVTFIRTKNTKLLRSKYRSLDVFIVDDVQFIAGKSYVQEEFYHTFNAIVQRGGQIIMTSDRPPHEIKELEDRLRSRFAGGLIIDMQKPDFELRTAILLIKAQQRKIDIDMEAAKEIAESITDSRELEGALLKLLSISLSRDQSNVITTAIAKEELDKRDEVASKKITPAGVIKTVCAYYDIPATQIKSSTRKQSIALARQIIMYILREKTDLNYEEIAFHIKRKDHTTIMHGVDKIQKKIIQDDAFGAEIEDVIRKIIST